MTKVTDFTDKSFTIHVMVGESVRYRGVRTETKLAAGGFVALVVGVGSYIAIDHFGPQLHLGTQPPWMKAVEAAGVGVWAGGSTAGILADARIPVQQDSQLRRTGPIHTKSS